MWLARALVKSYMKIKLHSTKYLPVLWYIVFGFSKCSLEIVGNYTRPRQLYCATTYTAMWFLYVKRES